MKFFLGLQLPASEIYITTKLTVLRYNLL